MVCLAMSTHTEKRHQAEGAISENHLEKKKSAEVLV